MFFFLFFFWNNKKGNLFGVIFNCWNCVFRFVSFVVVVVIVVFIVGRYLGLVFVSLLYFTPDQRTMDERTPRKSKYKWGKHSHKTNERMDKQSKTKPQAWFKTKWSSSSAKFYTRKSLEKHTHKTKSTIEYILFSSSSCCFWSIEIQQN